VVSYDKKDIKDIQNLGYRQGDIQCFDAKKFSLIKKITKNDYLLDVSLDANVGNGLE
jgi:hypothetical protein